MCTTGSNSGQFCCFCMWSVSFDIDWFFKLFKFWVLLGFFCFNFSYGWYFTFVQGFVYLVLIYFQGFTTKQMVNPWKTYVKLSAVLMGSHGLTKGSLAFLNYPAQLMFKSTKVNGKFPFHVFHYVWGNPKENDRNQNFDCDVFGFCDAHPFELGFSVLVPIPKQGEKILEMFTYPSFSLQPNKVHFFWCLGVPFWYFRFFLWW